MSEKEMPAVEAENVEVDLLDQNSYELAFHVLPTIAEGEVKAVVEAIKAMITSKGGEIFDEEPAERFELAYEIVKHLEGKNRKFKSAYFGWIRFKATGENVLAITEEIDANTSILRHLMVKLSHVEEENPFRFHEAIRDQKMVTNVGEEEATEEVAEGDADNEGNDDTSSEDESDTESSTEEKSV